MEPRSSHDAVFPTGFQSEWEPIPVFPQPHDGFAGLGLPERTEPQWRSRFGAPRKALENVQRLVERNRSEYGTDRTAIAPMRIRRVGIIGAGVMGASIAAAHARHYFPVVLVDPCNSALARAQEVAAAELTIDLPSRQVHRMIPHLILPRCETESLADCDFVLESIVENASTKQALYAQLEQRLGPQTFWASNTSTIPIARLASHLADPSRFCGFHFCHPVRQRAVVELVRGPKTSDRTIAVAIEHAKALGKMPLVVEDGPGFVINRLLLAYLNEAMTLLLEGVTVEEVERAMIDFGMGMGPMEMLDAIGLDTALQAGLVLSEVFGERASTPILLVGMVRAGHLGCKSGAGFFDYPAQTVNPLVLSLIDQWGSPSKKPVRQSIAMRLLLPMVLEATRILEEGKVRDPRDIDLGVIFGLGFPAFRGGLLWWADTLGAADIMRLADSTAQADVQNRSYPLLAELTRTGESFYSRFPTSATISQ